LSRAATSVVIRSSLRGDVRVCGCLWRPIGPVRLRQSETCSALSAEPEPNEGDVLARIWEALSGRIADANGDVLKLNAALREWFTAFDLRQMKRSGVRVGPVSTTVALSRMMGTPPRSRRAKSAR
jgi:hypothetical protein